MWAAPADMAIGGFGILGAVKIFVIFVDWNKKGSAWEGEAMVVAVLGVVVG